MRPGPGSLRPIYISTGHRVSLDSAITLVRMCSKFRVPEPTRQVACNILSLCKIKCTTIFHIHSKHPRFFDSSQLLAVDNEKC